MNIHYFAVITDRKNGRQVTFGAWSENDIEKDIRDVSRMWEVKESDLIVFCYQVEE